MPAPQTNIYADLGFTAQGKAAPAGSFSGSATATGLTAVGATQAAGLALTSEINVVASSTVTTGIAVVLPIGFLGAYVAVVNSSANALSVFPPSGGTINGGSANAADAATVGAAASGVAGVKAYVCTSSNGLTWLRVQ